MIDGSILSEELPDVPDAAPAMGTRTSIDTAIQHHTQHHTQLTVHHTQLTDEALRPLHAAHDSNNHLMSTHDANNHSMMVNLGDVPKVDWGRYQTNNFGDELEEVDS